MSQLMPNDVKHVFDKIDDLRAEVSHRFPGECEIPQSVVDQVHKSLEEVSRAITAYFPLHKLYKQLTGLQCEEGISDDHFCLLCATWLRREVGAHPHEDLAPHEHLGILSDTPGWPMKAKYSGIRSKMMTRIGTHLYVGVIRAHANGDYCTSNPLAL